MMQSQVKNDPVQIKGHIGQHSRRDRKFLGSGGVHGFQGVSHVAISICLGFCAVVQDVVTAAIDLPIMGQEWFNIRKQSLVHFPCLTHASKAIENLFSTHTGKKYFCHSITKFGVIPKNEVRGDFSPCEHIYEATKSVEISFVRWHARQVHIVGWAPVHAIRPIRA